MKCKIVHKNMMDFLEGSLDDSLKYNIQTHLNECAKCAGMMRDFQYMSELIKKEKDISPDPFMFTRIKSKIEAYGKEEITIYPKLIFHRIAAIVVIALGISGGLAIGSKYLKKDKLISDYQTEIYFLEDTHQGSIESVLMAE